MLEKLKIYASLTTLLLFSIWFVSTINPDEMPTQHVSPQGPDYYMESFISTAFDVSGNIKQRLSAEKLAHFPIDQHSEVTNIKISVTEDDKDSWTIAADHGETDSVSDTIDLSGNIIISQPNNVNSAQVTTQSLQIDFTRHIAATDDEVLITSSSGSIVGQGMYIEFDEHLLSLNQNVKGRYASAL